MAFFNRKNGTDVLEREGFDAATTAVEDISGDYTLDVTHSRLGFSARHAMVTTVRGAFPAFEGTATMPYVANDGHTDSAPATVTVTVSGAPEKAAAGSSSGRRGARGM